MTFSTKVFWVKFQAIRHLPVAAVITCFVLQYAGLGRWLTHRNSESLLGRLVEVAKDAHADVRESIIDLRSTSDREWSFILTLKNYIDKFLWPDFHAGTNGTDRRVFEN